jgi:hypothetical protein
MIDPDAHDIEKMTINHKPIISTLKLAAKTKGTIKKNDQQIEKKDPGENQEPSIIRAINAVKNIVIIGNKITIIIFLN